MSKHHWRSPAKINLNLSILKQREDGYHDIETHLQLVNLYDKLYITVQDTLDISVSTHIPIENNLINRAALLLQKEAHVTQGARIILKKRIPIAQGLGGGSSNAATTLIALNQLWKINYSIGQLKKIGLSLGCDIPFFLMKSNAISRGKGERLERIVLPCQHYLLCHNKTICLTPIVYNGFHAHHRTSQNDLFISACHAYPDIKETYDFLSQFGVPHMTGSGGAFFILCKSRQYMKKVIQKAPKTIFCYPLTGLAHHPDHRCF